ncbi:hypothetical protein G9A89_015525 [Geosiphon pyriformis]|nr:hypothetical protein G9A89_015525 [Geosiphon pyriformis]
MCGQPLVSRSLSRIRSRILERTPVFWRAGTLKKFRWSCQTHDKKYREISSKAALSFSNVEIAPIDPNLLLWRLRLSLIYQPTPVKIWILLERLRGEKKFILQQLTSKETEHLFVVLKKNKFLSEKEVESQYTWLWKQLRKIRAELSEKSFNFLLREGSATLHQEVYTDMRQKGYIPSYNTFLCLIEKHCLAQDTVQARNWYQIMQKFGLFPNIYIYCLMIHTHVNVTKELDIANYLIRKMFLSSLIPTRIIVIEFIKEAFFNERYKDVEWAFETFFRKHRYKATVEIYHMIFQTLGTRSEWGLAQRIFNEMIEREIKPTEITFQYFINACVSYWDQQSSCHSEPASQSGLNGLQTALKYVEQMKPIYGLVPTPLTCLVLIERILYSSYPLHFIPASSLGKLTSILLSSKNHVLGFTREDWEKQVSDLFLIDLFSKLIDLGNVSLAHSVYMKLRERNNPFPLTTGSLILIDAWSKRKNYFAALEIYYDMISGGMKPSTKAYDQLMTGFSNTNDPDGAINFFRFARKTNQMFNENFYQQLIEVCIYNSRVQSAIEVYQNMIEFEFKPDICMYNTLLFGLFMDHDKEGVHNLLREMQRHHVSPSLDTFNILIRGYSRIMPDLTNVIRTYKSMISLNYKPDRDTYGNLILSHLLHGDMSGARQVFEANIASDIEIDIKAATKLLGAMVHQHDLEFCWKIYNRLKLERKLTHVIFQLLRHACYLEHDDKKAVELVSEMNTLGFKIDKTTKSFMD